MPGAHPGRGPLDHLPSKHPTSPRLCLAPGGDRSSHPGETDHIHVKGIYASLRMDDQSSLTPPKPAGIGTHAYCSGRKRL